jgi:predicted DNA-binding protein YlxM (UPF0122 family)
VAAADLQGNVYMTQRHEKEKRYGELRTEKQLGLLKLYIKNEVSLLEARLGLGEEIPKNISRGILVIQQTNE